MPNSNSNGGNNWTLRKRNEFANDSINLTDYQRKSAKPFANKENGSKVFRPTDAKNFGNSGEIFHKKNAVRFSEIWGYDHDIYRHG